MLRRVLVMDRSALPSVALIRPLVLDAPVEIVAEDLTATATPEGLQRWSPPGRASLDATRLSTLLGLGPNDLVVVGPLLRHSARARVELIVRLAIEHGAHVLSVGERCPAPPGVARHVAFVSEGDAVGLRPLAATLPRFAEAERVTGFLVRRGPGRRAALESTLRAAQPDRIVEVLDLPAFPISQAQAFDRTAVAAGVDLVVVSSDALSDAEALVRGFFAADALQHAERPMLVLPRTTPGPALLADRLASSDLLLLPGAPAWVVVERNGPLGRVQLAPTDRVRWGERVLEHAQGVVALSTEAGSAGPLSLERAPRDLCLLRALSPTKPLLLVDALSPPEVLAPLEALAIDSHLVFVRLRWDDPIEALRKTLMERAPWAGVPTVIDASAWLGDGGASDLPAQVDPLRIRRLAARLRSLGASIRTVIGGGPRCREQARRTSASRRAPASVSRATRSCSSWTTSTPAKPC